MRRHRGWSLLDWYGSFMGLAGVVIAAAVVSVGTAFFLFTHYRSEFTVVRTPPQVIQRAVLSSAAPPSGARLWLSAAYGPDDPHLVDVVAAGDVMMGSANLGLNPDIVPHADAASLIGGDLAAVFRRADIAFVNLEGPLYGGGDPPAKTCDHCIVFRSPTYYADVLESLHVGVAGLANNHSGDYGEAGRKATVQALEKRGIGYCGLDQDGARAATLRLTGNRTVAVVAFAPNKGTLDINDIPAAQDRVRALRKTHDLVIVSFHGGAEGWDQVHVLPGHETFEGEDRGDVVAFAHAAIDAGAALVVGQGPHVPRAVELYRGHLIAYSLGNFWTYTGVSSYAVSGLGPVLETWLAPDGSVAGFAIHSTRQAGLGVPHLDRDNEAARYVFYLTKTDFPQTGARLEAARVRRARVKQQAVAGSPHA